MSTVATARKLQQRSTANSANRVGSSAVNPDSAVRELRVAIVHDWLIGGGAELVVEQLHKMYPDAPIYTSYCTPEWQKRLDNKVVTGWLQHMGKLRKYIPFLRIWWFTRLKLDTYDIVISSSGAEAKGIKTKALHINYCHAPTHYYWSRYEEYMKQPGFGKLDWLARLGLKLLVAPLRKWDYKAAQRPDYIIANSTHTQTAIKQYYGRKSTVVFPPVYFERFQKSANQGLPRYGFIVSGRQTPYKRFDLAIQACTKLNLPLKVIGDGPDNTRLQSLAGPSVKFLGRISDEALEREFTSAKALLFPGIDDFGITAVEALASGTPVIAYKAGGAFDYINSDTGIFFDYQKVDSLCEALKVFQTLSFDPHTVQKFAKRFTPETFRSNFQKCLEKYLVGY